MTVHPPHPDHHRPLGDVDPRLDPLDELRGGIADQEIDHRHHREDLEVLVGGRREQLPAEHQVAHGDHRDQRGILEDRHEEVAERRDDDADRLWQDDPPHQQPARHSHRCAGLPLAFRDRLDAGSEHLGHIGGVVQRESHRAGHEWRQHDAGIGQHVVDEEELQQQRRAANELDVARCHHPQRRHPRDAGDADGKTEHQGQGERQQRDRDGQHRAFQQRRQELDHVVEWRRSFQMTAVLCRPGCALIASASATAVPIQVRSGMEIASLVAMTATETSSCCSRSAPTSTGCPSSCRCTASTAPPTRTRSPTGCRPGGTRSCCIRSGS